MNKLIVDALDLLLSTEKGIEEIVEALIKDADVHGPEADRLRHEAVETLRRARSQVVDRAGGWIERVAAEVLKRTNLPSRDDVTTLTESVQALREEVASLRDRVDQLRKAPARPRARKRPGKTP